MTDAERGRLRDELAARAREVAAQAPPLTEDQIMRLAAVLRRPGATREAQAA